MADTIRQLIEQLLSRIDALEGKVDTLETKVEQLRQVTSDTQLTAINVLNQL